MPFGRSSDHRSRDRRNARGGERRSDLESEMLTCAIEAGDIAPNLDPDATLDALFGPILYRALMGSGIPRGLLDTLYEELLNP
ncbi:TetR-like C-terminal domain-containing protein [Nocardia acidivorans]|uniref:TetR-like C-terminal domain-containing protein n=1 Tax=Nocardia acidivorans TaxID=404580 RepID=UPI000A073F83|nr:TetR-like C-terminal domain-containing protein [Nocardia acidivorans]